MDRICTILFCCRCPQVIAIVFDAGILCGRAETAIFIKTPEQKPLAVMALANRYAQERLSFIRGFLAAWAALQLGHCFQRA